MSRIPQRFKPTKSNRRGPLAVVTWDSVNLYYGLADGKGLDGKRVNGRGGETKIQSRHMLAFDDQVHPLQLLRQHLDQSGQQTERVVLLLPRSSLEMTSVSVPKVETEELPALIYGEVDQLLGDADSELVVDFLQLADTDEGEPTVRAVACSLRTDQVQRWREQAEQAGFRLLAITPRQLAPLSVIQRLQPYTAPVTVLLAVYSSEVEVAFYRRSELLFLRTIRTRTTDVDSLSDQIQTEVRRTISLANLDGDGESPQVVLHVVEGAEAADPAAIQESLAASLSADVRILDSPHGADGGSSDLILSGALQAWEKHQLVINMLAPKQSPKPPNPVARWSLIGALAVGAVVIAGYFLVADVAAMRQEVQALQDEVEESQKVAAKLQEKADETRLVQAWLSDSVDWLGQLQQLTDPFPDGQSASVSRLSAAASEDGGQFDISVQVDDQELVAVLENRLRTAGFAVTSKQVSEQAGSDYPWRFEARIRFPNLPLEEREDGEQFVSTIIAKPEGKP